MGFVFCLKAAATDVEISQGGEKKKSLHQPAEDGFDLFKAVLNLALCVSFTITVMKVALTNQTQNCRHVAAVITAQGSWNNLEKHLKCFWASLNNIICSVWGNCVSFFPTLKPVCTQKRKSTHRSKTHTQKRGIAVKWHGELLTHIARQWIILKNV